MTMQFNGLSVVVTGAGRGLGKAYALYLGGRGANILVNDPDFADVKAAIYSADIVVEQIRRDKGRAVANYDSVENGDLIIAQAVREFGRIDVLINHAGIVRDAEFRNLSEENWTLVTDVHIRGSFKCARAAWPHFRKQKFGRIIFESSAVGLYGNIGQSNYAAAKASQIGFCQSLAKEGRKYNILCNVIAPISSSDMNRCILSPQMLQAFKPEDVAPLIAYLSSPSSTESGSIFEVGGGHIAKLRWQRSKGLLLKTGPSLTPGAILEKWHVLNDFSGAENPSGPADFSSFIESAQQLQGNDKGIEPKFEGKVVLITGAAHGLGRAYAHMFARFGAYVIVNDLVCPEAVVREIQENGGNALAIQASAEDGNYVVSTAIASFKRIDILINNAGILRDKAFVNMTDEHWDQVLNVHLRGTFAMTKAAWPYFLAQRYGRIVNTTSTSGIYGNFGQANYATAKLGILGFSKTLAAEGQESNIFVNTIAPNAATNMTRNIFSEDEAKAFNPNQIAPLVVLLCSDLVTMAPSGGLYEVGSGWHARTRWQRSSGHTFPRNSISPEDIAEYWDEICAFIPGRSESHESISAAMISFFSAIERMSKMNLGFKSTNEFQSKIAKAQNSKPEGTIFRYSDRDTLLYNLSLGTKAEEMNFSYEHAGAFQPIPTFGVIPGFGAVTSWSLSEILPNFSPTMLLHGEQYLEIRKYPIPISASTVNYQRLIEVIDKGNSAIVVTGTTTRDQETGNDLFYSESSTFVRGSGGFGGPRSGSDRGAATALYTPPKRAPDASITEATSNDQAAWYRLNGDRNPLHIDASFAAVSGFQKPILHGLCFLGISAKHIISKFGLFEAIKVRFNGVVFPGQTLRTDMWREGNVVKFQVIVVETGKPCIGAAGAKLLSRHNSAKL